MALFLAGKARILRREWCVRNRRKIIKYNHLVANCLIFYNVFSISKLIHEYEKQKEGFNKELICYLSPYMTAHVNRVGQYHIDSNRKPGNLPFNPSTFSKNIRCLFKCYVQKNVGIPLIPSFIVNQFLYYYKHQIHQFQLYALKIFQYLSLFH